MTETRPGWKTTEFWLVILSNLLVNVGAIDVGGAKWRGVLLVASIAGYALARGLAKSGVPEGFGNVGDEGDTDADPQPVTATQAVNFPTATSSSANVAAEWSQPEGGIADKPLTRPEPGE